MMSKALRAAEAQHLLRRSCMFAEVSMRGGVCGCDPSGRGGGRVHPGPRHALGAGANHFTFDDRAGSHGQPELLRVALSPGLRERHAHLVPCANLARGEGHVPIAGARAAQAQRHQPADDLAASRVPGRTLVQLTSVSDDDLGEELALV